MDSIMELQNYDFEETNSEYESDSSDDHDDVYYDNHDEKKEKVEETFQDEIGLKRIMCINTRLLKTRAMSLNFTKPMENLEEFIEISKCLCSILPPVSQSSLFEVDDLLYNELINGDDKCLMEDKDLYHRIDASLYSSCYIAFMKEGVVERNVFMDTALMKLAEHIPVDFENRLVSIY